MHSGNALGQGVFGRECSSGGRDVVGGMWWAKPHGGNGGLWVGIGWFGGWEAEGGAADYNSSETGSVGLARGVFEETRGICGPGEGLCHSYGKSATGAGSVGKREGKGRVEGTFPRVG